MERTSSLPARITREPDRARAGLFGRCVAMGLLAALTGCGGESTEGSDPPPPGNLAPVLSGLPSDTVVAGASYRFEPAAFDANGDVLVFTIQNKPSWATFNPADGTISGTPSMVDVGTHVGIVVRATDGWESNSLPSFGIRVVAPGASGTAQISWNPPTQNEDDTPLFNLAGYWIFEGSRADTLMRLRQVTDPDALQQALTGLSPGSHFFAMTAYSYTGAESPLSNVASKVIP